MVESPFIDAVLLRLFRHRTRDFLKMEKFDGHVPSPPTGGCYLYVHIPFCEVLCPFCSFHRVPHCSAQARRYFGALREEIRRYHQANYQFTGVYFGGGTPTSEPAELLETIGLVRQLFPVGEISVETNPNDLKPGLLQALRVAGVTRLSVGVQSFDDQLLREMERLEKYGSGAEIVEKIRSAAGLFPTLNVDLIFNQPHQTIESLQRDLAIIRPVGANQVSCYPLMTSPNVRRRMAGNMGVPDQRRLRSFYETIRRNLEEDFQATSAWCFSQRGGCNDEYILSAENYVGVGSGAFSYLAGVLYGTTFSLPTYEQRIARGLTGLTTRHQLSTGDQMRYTLLMQLFGLRLDRAWVRQRHGPGFFWRLGGELLTLRLLGAISREDGGWRLNPRGRYWLLLMMAEFFESVNGYREVMRQRVDDELAPRSDATHMTMRPKELTAKVFSTH